MEINIYLSIVHVIHLRCFGELVAGIGIMASAGDVIHITALSHLGGGFVRHSVWLSQVLQWAGLRAPPMRARWCTVVCFGRIRIPYKCPEFAGRDPLDTKPVTEWFGFFCGTVRILRWQRAATG